MSDSTPWHARYGSDLKRIVCHFSCGAASAVATKTVIELNKYSDDPLPLEIIYCLVRNEHPDNLRFLEDCARWFGVTVTVLINEKYDGDVDEVIRRERFINSKDGAPCTKLLKRELRKNFRQFRDLDVFGFTAEEQNRHDRMIDADADIRLLPVLIETGLDKGACLAILERAGIDLPVMYKMGYDHNNCIGCVKGGAWYWNKIRVDFPLVFQKRSELEQWLGHPMLRISGEGVYLKDLHPTRGRKHEEPKIECGAACEYVEQTIYAAGLL